MSLHRFSGTMTSDYVVNSLFMTYHTGRSNWMVINKAESTLFVSEERGNVDYTSKFSPVLYCREVSLWGHYTISCKTGLKAIFAPAFTLTALHTSFTNHTSLIRMSEQSEQGGKRERDDEESGDDKKGNHFAISAPQSLILTLTLVIFVPNLPYSYLICTIFSTQLTHPFSGEEGGDRKRCNTLVMDTDEENTLLDGKRHVIFIIFLTCLEGAMHLLESHPRRLPAFLIISCLRAHFLRVYTSGLIGHCNYRTIFPNTAQPQAPTSDSLRLLSEVDAEMEEETPVESGKKGKKNKKKKHKSWDNMSEAQQAKRKESVAARRRRKREKVKAIKAQERQSPTESARTGLETAIAEARSSSETKAGGVPKPPSKSDSKKLESKRRVGGKEAAKGRNGKSKSQPPESETGWTPTTLHIVRREGVAVQEDVNAVRRLILTAAFAVPSSSSDDSAPHAHIQDLTFQEGRVVANVRNDGARAFVERVLEGSQFVASDAEGHVRMVFHVDGVAAEFPPESLVRLLGEPIYNPGVPLGALTFVTRVRAAGGRWAYFVDVSREGYSFLRERGFKLRAAVGEVRLEHPRK